MTLIDGYHDVPPGKLANVVTNLEMRERPRLRPEAPGLRVRLRRMNPSDAAGYRTLFHKVGDPYLWFSRLLLDDEALRQIIGDPGVEVYAVERDGLDEGMLELDFRAPGEAEITFFGWTDALVGTGAGRWLMNRALEIAWARPISRLWVHTCTLDHPSAVAFYVRSGFVPFKRQIEICDDPRITGLVPSSAAPDEPML